MRQTVIVEGKEDIRAVKAAVDCAVIATGGTHFGRDKLEEIRSAHRRGGIIILTDPDYAGGSIREKITKVIPDAGHAYLPRRKAQAMGRAGVEYASPETIRTALEAVRTPGGQAGTLTASDLFALGLTGTAAAGTLRRQVGRALGIGECNAARFLDRVNRYAITEEEIRAAIEGIHGQ